MIYVNQYKVLIDTNVLYSIIVRDFLFWLAYYDVFIPKWSKTILKEWEQVILSKGISKTEAQRRITITSKAFPFAMVTGYKFLIPSLNLPDEKDRHVLAAAIKAKAHLILTFNIKDFPKSYTEKYSIKVQSPDEFLLSIIELHPQIAKDAFLELVSYKKNPKMNKSKVLESYKKIGLNKTVESLQKLL